MCITTILLKLTRQITRASFVCTWLQEANRLASLQDADDIGARMLTGSSSSGGIVRRTVAIEQLRRETNDKTNMPLFVNISAWVTQVRSLKGDKSITYPACNEDNGGRACGKKMTYDEASEAFKCERHIDNPKKDPDYRYMMALEASDTTSSISPTLIGDAGETLFRIPADEYHVSICVLLLALFSLSGCHRLFHQHSDALLCNPFNNVHALAIIAEKGRR